VVTISVIFLGCDSNEPNPAPPILQLLKLTVDASYNTKNIDNWVMVHDKNGVLLGIKKFERGQVVSLETNETVPEDQISVTLFRCDSANLAQGLPMKVGVTFKAAVRGEYEEYSVSVEN
jgi:hypothetical protein